jgi:phosphoglycolate phosphatase-like HAD superfamily hydrolase
VSKPKRNQKVILWDIDGTLLTSRASRIDKHVKAAELLLGRDLPGQKRTAGKTDRQILVELLEPTGCIPDPVDIATALGILDMLSMQEIRKFPIPTISGVVAALELVRHVDWVNGLLTGNTPARALAKLQSAGIWEFFDENFAYFGDKSSNRCELVGSSIFSIQAKGDCEVIIVGDTPLDIQSAQEHGLQIVAVATGSHAAKELHKFNPNLLITDWKSGFASFEDLLTSKSPSA